jgi:hypothetical protein
VKGKGEPVLGEGDGRREEEGGQEGERRKEEGGRGSIILSSLPQEPTSLSIPSTPTSS